MLWVASTGKNKEELEILRKASNDIDSWASPFKAIVSALMLKEGWDVRNVTVICGLRAYVAQSNILPEQTLGRGLRRMYFGNDTVRETVSVLGTPAFMDFVESIQSEGVTFDRVPMGSGTERHDSLVVEVDAENADKNLDELDIPLPRLTRSFTVKPAGVSSWSARSIFPLAGSSLLIHELDASRVVDRTREMHGGGSCHEREFRALAHQRNFLLFGTSIPEGADPKPDVSPRNTAYKEQPVPTTAIAPRRRFPE